MVKMLYGRPWAGNFPPPTRRVAMKPIPNEIRRRILDDGNDGMTEIEAAEKWKASPSFITKRKRHVRETGFVEPKHGKTGTKIKLEPYHDPLKQIVTQTPDATIEEIREQLPVLICPQTVANVLIKLKLVYKKSN